MTADGGGFGGAALPDLRAMITQADAAGLDSVAAKWSAVYEALRQAQDDLLHHTLAATTHWTGAAADAFSARADELHRSLGNGAAYAFNASSGVSFAADALRTAQSTMPAEPDPLEQVAQCAATKTCGEPSPLMRQRQREAAAVMERLEEQYRAAGEMIGTPASFEKSLDRGVFPPSPERTSFQAGTHEIPEPSHARTPAHALGDSSIGNSIQPDPASGSLHLNNATDLGPSNGPAATLETRGFKRRDLASEIHPQYSTHVHSSSVSSIKATPRSSLPTGHILDNLSESRQARRQEIRAEALTTRGPQEDSIGHMPVAWAPPAIELPQSDGVVASEKSMVVHPTHVAARPRIPEATPHRTDSTPEGYSRASEAGSFSTAPTELSSPTPEATPFDPASPPYPLPSARQRKRKDRPAYLIEDESFWAASSEVNPPVIK